MRSLLLWALTGATVLAGALTAPAATAVHARDGYESRAITRIQQERAARGLEPLRTSGTRAECLERYAQRWSKRPRAVAKLARAAAACHVPSVSAVRYVSSTGPARQVSSLLGQQTGRTLLTDDGRLALALGHTRVTREHSVVILLAPLRTSVAVDTAPARADILTLTNAERTALGLPAVTTDSCLMAAAQRHANHLASVGRLEHQDLGAVEAGCETRGGIGENVLYNSVGTGAAAVAGWMSSEVHRTTLLDPSFGLLGVGVAHDPASGRYYAVQVFAGRR